MKIISGSSNLPLSEKIAEKLHLSLSPVEFHTFPDGEHRVQIQEKVVDDHVVIVQSTSTPVDQNYMELFFLIDGARRSGASKITVVMPYFGYQRQDHIFRDGEAVSLEVVIKILQSLTVNKLISFDLHTVRIPELFTIPVSHLSAVSLFEKKIQETGEDVVLASPDMGGVRRVKILADLLGVPYVATVKDRDLETGVIKISSIEGDEKNLRKIAVIVDDMISSGKTMVESAKLLMKHGVEKVFVFATHAVFSQDAPEILQNSEIEKVYVTDSVFVAKEKQFEKLQIISIADLITKELE